MDELVTKVVTGRAPVEVEVKAATTFIDLVEAGAVPQEAAKDLGTNLRRLMKNPLVASFIERTYPWVLKDEDLEEQLVRAAMLREMATAEEPRDRIAAARVLKRDKSEASVVINLSDEIRNMPSEDPWAKETK